MRIKKLSFNLKFPLLKISLKNKFKLKIILNIKELREFVTNRSSVKKKILKRNFK